MGIFATTTAKVSAIAWKLDIAFSNPSFSETGKARLRWRQTCTLTGRYLVTD
jgi:hypothetical protein